MSDADTDKPKFTRALEALCLEYGMVLKNHEVQLTKQTPEVGLNSLGGRHPYSYQRKVTLELRTVFVGHMTDNLDVTKFI